MTITIENPKLTRFVQGLLEAGTYASPEEVVEAALTEMSDEDSDFDDETIEGLRQAIEDEKHGRHRSIEDVAKEFGVTLRR